MGLYASEGNGKGGGYVPLEPGVYPAICYGVVDLGHHYSEQFKKSSHKVLFMWELPGEEYEKDGKKGVKSISKQFNLSLHEKSMLRPFLESIRGRKFTDEELKKFDVFNVIGSMCQLNIVNVERNGKTRDEIASAIPMPKGSPKVAMTNAKIAYSIEDDIEFPETMPQWVQDRIKQSEEFAAMQGDKVADAAEAMGGEVVEDAPF